MIKHFLTGGVIAAGVLGGLLYFLDSPKQPRSIKNPFGEDIAKKRYGSCTGCGCTLKPAHLAPNQVVFEPNREDQTEIYGMCELCVQAFRSGSGQMRWFEPVALDGSSKLMSVVSSKSDAQRAREAASGNRKPYKTRKSTP